MKISCESCGARYTIADDKFLGRIVKIRCKKCSVVMVLDGVASMSGVSNLEGKLGDSQNSDVAESDVAQVREWIVNVEGGDQRRLSASEVASLYALGTVRDDTYCWRDGMVDWLPLNDVEELYLACRSTAGDVAASLAQELSGVAEVELPTAVGAEFANDDVGFAARRIGNFQSRSADLFSSSSDGHDGERSTPRGEAGTELFPASVTGRRNEDSVLFSLASLTERVAPSPSHTAVTEGSGLIDIRALSAAMSKHGAKSEARVEDVMNLTAVAFGSAVIPPAFVPPELPLETPVFAASKSHRAAWVLGGFGLGALVAIVLVFALKDREVDARDTSALAPIAVPLTPKPALLAVQPNKEIQAVKEAELPRPEASKPVPIAAPIAVKEPTAPPGPVEVAVPPPKPQDEARQPNRVARLQPVVAPKPRAAVAVAARSVEKPATEKALPKRMEAATAAKSQPSSFESAIKKAAEEANSTPPAAPAAAASFDRGAALAALEAAASTASACKRADGPTGQGHARITFSPSGHVSSVEIDRAPFEGTAVGACVAGKLRAARIPPFTGPPVASGKSFSVN